MLDFEEELKKFYKEQKESTTIRKPKMRFTRMI